jgi:para-nitrobenzyl esterase
MTLFGMPRARGLFHKAINMSGPVTRLASAADAAQKTREVLAGAGVDAADAARMRALPLHDLLEVQRRLSGALGAAFGMGDGAAAPLQLGWGPVVDGVHVTEHPFDEVAASGADGVPLLVGVTSHDPALLMAGSAEFASLSHERAVELAQANFGPEAVAILDELRAAHADEPARLRYARVVNEMTFRATSQTIIELAARRDAPVYAYEFAQPTDILGGLLGACHSLDLAYVFVNADRSAFTGTDPSRGEVSRRMALSWAAFARTGSPQHPDVPDWPAYTAGSPVSMRIAEEWALEPVQAPAVAGVRG